MLYAYYGYHFQIIKNNNLAYCEYSDCNKYYQRVNHIYIYI